MAGYTLIGHDDLRDRELDAAVAELRARGYTLRVCRRLPYPKNWQIRIDGWDVAGRDVEDAGVSSCTIIRYHDDGTVYNEPITLRVWLSVIAFWLFILACAVAIAVLFDAGMVTIEMVPLY